MFVVLGKRKDSDSLVLSQRSNGLQFSNHQFQPSQPIAIPQRQIPIHYKSNRDGEASAFGGKRITMPRIPLYRTINMRNFDVPQLETPLLFRPRNDLSCSAQYNYRSLIPPTGRNPEIRRRRVSCSATSVKSMSSSFRSRRHRSDISSLDSLPSEILEEIFRYLDQHTWHALILTNSNFVELGATFLYDTPIFASIFRFAQFVNEVSHNPYYASLVCNIDLHYFYKLNRDPKTKELLPLAGWREFKFKTNDIYTMNQYNNYPGLPSKPTSHWLPSPFLKCYHRCRDVPLGHVIHAISSCTRLKSINLSRVQLAADFWVNKPTIHPTSTHSLLFTSDINHSYHYNDKTVTPFYADEIITWICKLRHLEALILRNCVWLTTQRVEKFMIGCWRGEERIRCVERKNEDDSGVETYRVGGLKRVDFRDGGMDRHARWAVKGERDVVERIVVDISKRQRDL